MTEPSWVGSEAHKALLCRFFLETHDRYKPAVIPWPTLSQDALERLTALPIWDIAVATEGNAALRMECFAAIAADALVREAVALNAFEERRHKEVLGHMVRFYGIVLKAEGEYLRPKDPLWAFLCTGYGELMDSFFAFGLFALAKRSGFFPLELVEVFEPVIQEEARHNLFFVNWLAWERHRRGPLGQLLWLMRCAAALTVAAWNRVGTAKEVDSGNFTRKGGEAIGMKPDPRGLVSLCLEEHDRRMSAYDARLLRPRLMPSLARLILFFLPRAREEVAQGSRASL